MGLYGGPGLGNLGAILWWFSGARGAVLRAKREEIKRAFVSQSIDPESLHEAMFREHVSQTKMCTRCWSIVPPQVVPPNSASDRGSLDNLSGALGNLDFSIFACCARARSEPGFGCCSKNAAEIRSRF
jgi:hypothetical protein